MRPEEDHFTEPTSARERELLDRYVAALQANDIDGLIEILTSDATWEMPPFSAWFHGAAMIGLFARFGLPDAAPQH